MTEFTSVGTGAAGTSRLLAAIEGYKIYAVLGDCHAAYLPLRALARVAGDLPILQLCLLGDVLDRGCPGENDSIRTVNEILRIRDDRGEIPAVRGNHEQMFLESLAYATDMAKESGSETYYSEVKRLGSIPKEHLAWIRSLPPVIQLSPRLVLAHGGPSWKYRHLRVRDQPGEDLMWAYSPFAPDAEPKVTIVRGHEVVQEPTENRRIISLDTGVGFQGGVLTMGLVSDEPSLPRRLLAYVQADRSGKLTGCFVRERIMKYGGAHDDVQRSG